ncbi:hypothetical protein LCGC14_1802030, partial [marine sediment metagenome]
IKDTAITLQPSTFPGLKLRGQTSGSGNFIATLAPAATLSGTRVATLPDASGEIALDSELHAEAHGPSQHTEGVAWRLVYQDVNGDEQEIGLGTDGQVLTSTGAALAPQFEALPAAGAHGPGAHTSFANWKVIYTDGSGDQQELALGTDGQVLTSTGASSAPAFEAAGGGGGTPTIPLTALHFSPTVANGCAEAVKVSVGSGATSKLYWVLDFDDGADEHAIAGPYPLPEDYDGGTMTARIAWTTTATDADGVAWAIKLLSIDDGDDISAASWGSAVVTTDDAQSNADDFLVTAESSAITPGGTAVAPESLWVMIFRDVSDANDDMAEDARLISVKLEYTRS